MRSLKYIVFVVIGSLFFTACKDIETLKRDNPLDEKGNPGSKIPEIRFNSYRLSKLHSVSWGECPTCSFGVYICLKNTGTGDAKGVKATFSTTSSYVSNLRPTSQVDYGSIAAGKVRWADYGNRENFEYEPTQRSYTIQFIISSSAPMDTEIPISIVIVDASGNSWTSSFSVPVQEFMDL